MEPRKVVRPAGAGRRDDEPTFAFIDAKPRCEDRGRPSTFAAPLTIAPRRRPPR
jgi:hypothetical protein